MSDRFDELLAPGNRGAVVMAHPDDETLWCGGLLNRLRTIDWTVICCSIPRRDPIRAWKFFDACAVLGARGVLWPFTEPDPAEPLGLPCGVDLEPFDVIVTHGPRGEYGHKHHQILGDVVAQDCPGRCIRIGTHKGGQGEWVLDLIDGEVKQKMAALRCYDHCSASDHGKPKWQALLDVYGESFDFGTESYDLAER